LLCGAGCHGGSDHGVGRLALQHGQRVGHDLAQFAPVADHVDRAFFLQELGSAESLPAA
jgi:hypothetical protein